MRSTRYNFASLTRRSQRGLTLIEVLAALVILGMIIAGAVRLTESYSSSLRTSTVGQETAFFGNALQQYVSDNNASIAATATATTPVLIQVSTLTAANYLSPGFSSTNAYGQSVCGLVLQPNPGQLNAIVVTEGGTAIDDLDLGNVAASIGAAGGGLYSSAPATLTGTMGGWSFAAGGFAAANNLGLHCNGTPGPIAFTAGHPVMALWFTEFNTTSGLLYRNAVPGQPQLNTMNTPIIMNTLQTAGNPCTSVGAFAQNDTQTSLVMCGSNNVWNTVGNTVAGIAAGNPCTTANQLGSDALNVGYVCNGSVWSPVTQFATYSGTAATGCTTNNQLATSIQTGEALVCRNNVWVKFGSLITSQPQNEVGQVIVSADQFVPAPTCDWGGRAWGFFETINTTTDLSETPPRETMKLAATFVTSPSAGWNITYDMVDTSGNSFDASYTNLTELFHYGCYY